ncbi:hypothetical protein BDR26DRAFT_939982 [Obelidium mucronatum]|nr:hypothetical protein BDR26DRAFT_939982 [Obelidium mucronatum]
MGLIAGGLNNLLGPRVLLVVGGSTYAIYAASQYVIHLTQYTVETVVTISNATGTFIIPKTAVLVPEATGAFAVAAGGVLGIGAGMLWAAQGQIVMTYPTESQKGTYFAKFWVIFNLGTVLGSVIALGESYNSETNPASNSLYIIFIGLMACGSAAALLIVSPSRVIREDHSQVQTPPTNVSREFVGILRLFIDPAMIVLFVPCLSSNWFYTYQFGNVQAYFDTRTCAFNNIFYWTSQMAGSWILGNMFLDNPRQNRIKRAWMGAIILSSSTLLVWGVGAVFQYSWNTRTLHEGDFVKQPLEWIGPYLVCELRGTMLFPNVFVLAYWSSFE